MSKIFTILAIAMFLTTPVNAAQLQFNFTGIMTYNSVLSSGISFGGKAVGEAFSGSFTLDTLAISSDDAVYTVAYYPGHYFDLTLEGYSLNVSHLIVRSSAYDGITFKFSDDRTNLQGILSLRSTSNIFSDTSIPTSLDINDFDRENYIFLQDDLGFLEGGPMDTLQAVVPIPAAAWLFSSGLMVIVCVGRRRLSK